MTLPPAGDRGQRFEVTYAEADDPAGVRRTFGWAATMDGARAFTRSIDLHPSMRDPEIRDRMTGETVPTFPTAVWSGTLVFLGVPMACHVLDTGERIVEPDSVEQLLIAIGRAHHNRPDKTLADPDVLAEIERFVAWSQTRGPA